VVRGRPHPLNDFSHSLPHEDIYWTGPELLVSMWETYRLPTAFNAAGKIFLRLRVSAN